MAGRDGPMRLGFAVKVLGRPDLKSNDARRWRNEPHLRVSIGYLREIFAYLAEKEIRMYRMSSDLAPYATHPEMPRFHGQVAECAEDLAELGDLARRLDLRLSFHPSQYILLNSTDEVVVEKSIADLVSQAEILDAMGMGPEGVLIVHAGAVYGDKVEGRRRWVEAYGRLPEPVRRRLVLENDDLRYSAADVLEIHDRTGVPLVFDHQHFWCNNFEGADLRETLGRFLRTWPEGVRPKVHFSSPRTEFREVRRKNRSTGKVEILLQPPVWTGHADFIQPFEFLGFMRLADGLPDFDLMLEAKAKDLALQKLRRDLATYAPDLATRFGLDLAPSPPDEPDEDIPANGIAEDRPVIPPPGAGHAHSRARRRG